MFQRDALFSRCITSIGYEMKLMNEDGACLFRAIADQIYGDQELHHTVRSSCMDYIVCIFGFMIVVIYHWWSG